MGRATGSEAGRESSLHPHYSHDWIQLQASSCRSHPADSHLQRKQQAPNYAHLANPIAHLNLHLAIVEMEEHSNVRLYQDICLQLDATVHDLQEEAKHALCVLRSVCITAPDAVSGTNVTARRTISAGISTYYRIHPRCARQGIVWSLIR
jgi:hypothetical protein